MTISEILAGLLAKFVTKPAKKIDTVFTYKNLEHEPVKHTLFAQHNDQQVNPLTGPQLVVWTKQQMGSVI
jgi:hypothetical protein